MKKVTKIITRVLVWAMLLLVIFLLWKNPEIIIKAKEYIKPIFASETVEKPDPLASVYNKIDTLQDKIYNLEAKTSEELETANTIQALNLRLDSLEKTNINIIDSKADVAAVLGVITRTDQLEERVSKIAKISDQGALVLTATMLVKERADDGSSFEYEAEVLSQLAEGDIKIKNEVEVISSLSSTGVATDYELISDFNKLYKSVKKQETAMTWKERLKAKFREFVQIKKTNQIVSEEENKLAEIKGYVDRQQFSYVLEALNSDDFKEFDDFIDKVSSKIAFEKAVSKISAYSLAVMKVNHLKNNGN